MTTKHTTVDTLPWADVKEVARLTGAAIDDAAAYLLAEEGDVKSAVLSLEGDRYYAASDVPASQYGEGTILPDAYDENEHQYFNARF